MRVRRTRRWSLTLALAGTLAAGCEGLRAGELAEMLEEGRVELDVRYRFEWVEQSGFVEDAEASTLRARLGYTTGAVRGFTAHADFEHIRVVGAERFDSTANGLTAFPVVADPADTELNQAYVAWAGLADGEVRLGRQRIKLDNDRFVGNVGWRQNEQTFDALSVRKKLGERVSIFLAHVNNANRIFGEHHSDPGLAELELDAELLHGSIKLSPGVLTLYGYFLELEAAPLLSQRNLGARFVGQRQLGAATKLLYTVELADQSDYADGSAAVDASYRLVEVGVSRGRFAVKLAGELLGGDGTYGFSTPLATLHAFNGWTDRFLATPAAGLDDRYVSVGGTIGGFWLQGVYHDFRADSSGAGYGDELGVLVSRKLGEDYSVGVKFARYRADSFSVDTDKLWVTLEARP